MNFQVMQWFFDWIYICTLTGLYPSFHLLCLAQLSRINMMCDRCVCFEGWYADLCSSSRVTIVNARLSKSGNRGGDQSLGGIAVVPYCFYFWISD